MEFRDDPVWKHHRPATQEKFGQKRERMLFWVKPHPARVLDCVATLFTSRRADFSPPV